MRNFRSLGLSALMSLLLGACAAPTAPPGPYGGESAAIGIHLAMPRLGINRQEPQIVYFVRVDDESNVRVPSVIRSTFAKDGRVYLLNVPAGEYAAVAAFYYYPVQIMADSFGGPPKPMMHALGDRVGFITYFSDELIRRARVRVKAGAFAFAGNYVIGQEYCCRGADRTQIHYADVISWRSTRDWPHRERIYSTDFRFLGSVDKAKDDEAARAAFLRHARLDLGAEWAPLMR